MASGIIFSGLASGIDSEAIISALTQAAKVPMNRLTAQKSDFSAQSRKLSDIKTKLTTLQNAAKALDTRSEALGNKVTSNEEKVLKATAAGGASMGAFKVTVTQVARAHRTYGDVVASSSDAGLVGGGDLKIKVGDGEEITVTITTDDSLSAIASKINASGADVTAGVVKTEAGYQLQVSGRKTGAENAITFTEEPGLTLGLANSTKEFAAQDAWVEMDGLKFTSATNSITGAVPGVTLNVVAEGEATIQVDRDGDGLKTKLNSFITAYNDVMKTLNAEFTHVGGVTKGRDSLMGDGALHSLQAALRSSIAAVTDNGQSKLTTFGSLGIMAQRDGTLMLDDAKYTKAVQEDYEGIATALAGRADLSGLMTKISDAVDPYARTDGTLRTKIDNLASRNRRIDQQVASMQTRLDKYEESLRRQYAALEQTIAGLNSQGNSLGSILASM